VSEKPAEVIGAEALRLCRVRPDESGDFQRLIGEGVDHIRPWMPWVSREPLTLDQRRAELECWDAQWEAGTGWDYGIWFAQELVGKCGLYPRTPTEVALGYWIGARHLGRGHATAASGCLTDALFEVDGVAVATIRHDAANIASRRVAEKLGFRKVGEEPHSIDAPGQTGCSWVWQVTRQDWRGDSVS